MKKFKYLIILIVLGIIVSAGLVRIGAQTTGATLKYDSKKDTLYTPRTETIQDTLDLAGSVDTDQAAILQFQNPGKLVWVGVKVGDHVRPGQAVASLDKKQLQKDLQTQFNNYQTQLSQFTDNQKNYIGTADQASLPDTIKRILVRTQNSLDNSVISYEIADMAVAEATITSPIDGIVTNIAQALPGTNITPPTTSFTVINPKSVYFKADIDQSAVNQIKVGQKAVLSLDSLPDRNFDSQITYIAFTPVAGQTSTVYEVRFLLPADNQDLTYRLGMDGDANLILAQAVNAVTIPTDAVNDDNGQSYVYVYHKSDQQLVRQNITTGIENDTTIQVTQGLSANDQVAVIQK
jgi:RND family efflux transporter MFP subunit